jgi:pimeloyl-ACP methyl ester carboxylesterase
MKIKLFSLVVLLILYQNLIIPQDHLSGNWLGKLKLPNGVELTIVFKISQTEYQKFSALLDSPDQGAKDIPCDEVITVEDSVIIEVPAISGSYKGRINRNNKTIKGIWKQAGSIFNLNLSYTENYTGLRRPQEPKPPFPYITEELLIENQKDDVYLSGTLTFPKLGENFPAVILITGSGPQNRDEEIFGHKPFLVISDFLTRNGFAVLRYDERGVGASTGDFSKATLRDFANDVLSAIDFLKSRDEINKNQIVLIGHSEGAMIAQMVALENSSDIASIIMLAGVAIPGDELILLQSRTIATLEGRPEKEIDRAIVNQKLMIELLKSDKANKEIEEEIRKIVYQSFTNLTEIKDQPNESVKRFVELQIKTVMSDWYRDFLKFNPSEYLEKISIPVLALNGEKDAQVPSKENLRAIESALKKAGNKKYKVLELKGLNHLFQSCETGSISEYGKIEETFSQLALDEILKWLKEICK